MKNWVIRNNAVLLVSGMVCLYILSVLLNLGDLTLRIEESRRAIISIEMLDSGNYLQPKTLGWEYYNKPPVFNWILAAFVNLTGSDAEFVLRLPSLASLLVLAASQYFVSRRFLPKNIAALSAFFTMTSADLYFYTLSNGAEIDVFYSLIVYLQAIAIFYFYEKRKHLALFLLSWSLCAIGFLTKGYPSIVFQGLTMLALVIYARSAKLLFKPQQFLGILLFMILTGSYYYVYNQYSNSTASLVNLLQESLLKSAVGNESSGRLHRAFSYPLVLLRVLSPWCLLLLLLFKIRRAGLWNNPLVKFSALFILVNIGVYWITGAQKTRYIIMFIPFAMTVIAYIYWQAFKQDRERVNRYLKYAGLFFCLVFAVLLAIPFYSDTAWWTVGVAAAVLLGFLIIFYRFSQYRIWLFITGFILTRLIYAGIGIPLKGKGETNYEVLATGIARKNNFNQVNYWGYPDTLNLDIVVGDTLYKWKDAPVKVLPFFIKYQMPYYFYKATGSLVKFDTVMEAGKTYISFKPYLQHQSIEPIDSFFDKQFSDYFILFRPKAISRE